MLSDYDLQFIIIKEMNTLDSRLAALAINTYIYISNSRQRIDAWHMVVGCCFFFLNCRLSHPTRHFTFHYCIIIIIKFNNNEHKTKHFSDHFIQKVWISIHTIFAFHTSKSVENNNIVTWEFLSLIFFCISKHQFQPLNNFSFKLNVSIKLWIVRCESNFENWKESIQNE